jgi:cytochrome P450
MDAPDIPASIPSHIPAHLVRDIDYLYIGRETDLFAHFKKLQDGPDLFYTPHHGGHWIASRFEDMETMLENRNKDFSNYYSSLPKHPFRFPLVEWDGQLHTGLRLILAPFFTPKSITNLEQKTRELTIALIDGFYAKGECDFTRDFAQQMPIIILMNLLDLPPDDTPYLLGLSEKIVRGGDDPASQEAAYGQLAAYIGAKILPARRARAGKDVFSALVEGTIDGDRRMTDEELTSLGCLLVAAGLDTVASMLGWITLFFAQHPQHRQYLIDNPDKLAPVLEELVRRHHIANIARTVVSDMHYKGVSLKAGEVILIPTPAAGIDERRYPDPFTVDFDRADKKNLAFGRGTHQCIGAYLARTELRVFLTEWLKRIPHFEVKAGEVPRTALGKVIAVRYLPLTWKVAAT